MQKSRNSVSNLPLLGKTMQLDLIYFDAGGGHRASATALKAVIEQQGRPWTVRMVNLREIIDPTDRFRRTVGIGVEEGYNRFIAKGWTWGAPAGLKMLQASIALARKPMVRRLAHYWSQTKPDMVVSLVPNFDRALYEGLKTAAPHVPFVTLLTDFADNPPHFWIEKGQKQSFICGTEKAVQQARHLGHDAAQIYPTSGMIMRPKFYDPITVERAVERQKLGLDPNAPTGLVLFGGSGAKVMTRIAKRLGDTQLIMICGNNAALAEKLRGMPSAAPHHIVGFTAEVPYYMHLADFFIGKPGPGSISEAVHMRLPVIVESNRRTLPQERYNAAWVKEHKVGIVLKHFRDVRKAVTELTADLPAYRAQTAKINNRAVFEIPDILERIFQRSATENCAPGGRACSAHGSAKRCTSAAPGAVTSSRL